MSELKICYDHKSTDHYFHHPDECHVCKMQTEITRLRAQLAETTTAIDNALIVGPQTTLGSYPSTKDALHALIRWEVDAALDPRVSARAAQLAEAEGRINCRKDLEFLVGAIDSIGCDPRIKGAYEHCKASLAHPAPAKVPDAIREYDGYVPPEDGNAAEYYVEGWNDCREAMLKSQGGE